MGPATVAARAAAAREEDRRRSLRRDPPFTRPSPELSPTGDVVKDEEPTVKMT
jgi:hypothetical protein